jgi:hypothetical protein
MTLRETPETFGATLRRAGIQVQPPASDTLRTQLQETLRRVQAGEALDELSRRDPEALCALATQRALSEHEAAMLLARLTYLGSLLQAAARERESDRGWLRAQVENAELWGRSCAELGRALERIADAFGEPGLAQDPERLADLAALAAVAWNESLLPNQQDDEHQQAATATPIPNDECTAGLPAAVHAAGSGESEQWTGSVAESQRWRTALPRDATTAALSAASEELTELRAATRQLARDIGEPGLEQDPVRLALRVNDHLECLRTERMPDEPELRDLVRDAAGLAPPQLGRLRQLAQAMERGIGAADEGLVELAGEALGRSMAGDVAYREALREILSMALGVAVPANAPIEPQAVVRQVAALWPAKEPGAQGLDADQAIHACGEALGLADADWFTQATEERRARIVNRLTGADLFSAPCPRPCAECRDGHHFGEGSYAWAREEPDHPAARAGLPVWMRCYHCPAWVSVDHFDDDHFDDGEEQ